MLRRKFFFTVLFFFFIVISLLAITNKLIPRTNPKAAATSAGLSLEPYCQDGFYKIPTELDMICSRAPHCNGYGYKELNTADKMPNPQKCMGDNGGKGRGCNGWVPLCCYEVARTGDYKKCIGYWERLWCTPSQCNEAKSHGASNSQCGKNGCLCAHAFKTYCGNVPPIPLSVRLEGKLPYGAPYTQMRSLPKHSLPLPTRSPIPTLKPPQKLTAPSPHTPPSPLPRQSFRSTSTPTPTIFYPPPTRKIIKLPQLPPIDLNPIKISWHKTTNTIKKPIVKTIQIDRTFEKTINRLFSQLIVLFQ